MINTDIQAGIVNIHPLAIGIHQKQINVELKAI